ncbi:MAG: aldehyde dehydrogenase family protein [Lachnospiraceae bacterium]
MGAVTEKDVQVVSELMARARKAQVEFEAKFTDMEKIREIVRYIGWMGVKYAEPIAEMAARESKMGKYDSKVAKMKTKMRGTMRDLQHVQTMGVVEEWPEKGLVRMYKPVGVIGAIIPCTNPEATPFIKAMNAIICRDAIIFSPHPRTAGTNKFCCDLMRKVLAKFGAPEDLVLSIDEPTMGASQELMAQCDLVIATGGSGLVKSAYSSGTPAYGVGAGNAVIIVDETCDLDDAAQKIYLSKTFDNATSCSSDNSIVVHESIYDELLAKLQAKHGLLCSPEQQEKLRQMMFLPTGHYNGKAGFAGATPEKIAELAGITDMPEGTEFFIVQEAPEKPEDIGNFEFPFGGEKLCVVLNVFKYSDFQTAIDIVNACHRFSGLGHSCGIHTTKKERAMELAAKTYTSRVMVNQATCLANSGSFTNGMPFTLSLGCGTWGGNAASENITWKQCVNNTWVAFPCAPDQPSDEELFGEAMNCDL